MVKEQKCLIGYIKVNEALELRFPKLDTFSESADRLSRNREPNFTQNERVYAIWCRPEVAGDVIATENVKAVEGFAMLNFQAASRSSFGENQNQPFAHCVDDGRPTSAQLSGARSKNV